MLTRRTVLAAGAAASALLSWPGRARAASLRLNGAFGLVATTAGPAGVVFEEEGGRALDPALAWHLGSNTKALTALTYAVLVDEGLCRWGATLAELFPDVPVDPALAGVTVEELMAHVSGLSDAGIDGAWLTARRLDPASPTEQRAVFAREWLGRAPAGPRGRFAYANASFMLLGAAIEAATGESWEEAMRGRLFQPLRLQQAGFGAPEQELWGRQTLAGATLPVDPAGLADNPAVLGPAGTVHMTAADYAEVLAMILRGGAPLIRAETLAHLLTPPDPALTYAGGWGLIASSGGPATLIHDGSNTFWYARAIVSRARGRALAAGTNRGGDEGKATVERVIAGLVSPPAA